MNGFIGCQLQNGVAPALIKTRGHHLKNGHNTNNPQADAHTRCKSAGAVRRTVAPTYVHTICNSNGCHAKHILCTPAVVPAAELVLNSACQPSAGTALSQFSCYTGQSCVCTETGTPNSITLCRAVQAPACYKQDSTECKKLRTPATRTAPGNPSPLLQ